MKNRKHKILFKFMATIIFCGFVGLGVESVFANFTERAIEILSEGKKESKKIAESLKKIKNDPQEVSETLLPLILKPNKILAYKDKAELLFLMLDEGMDFKKNKDIICTAMMFVYDKNIGVNLRASLLFSMIEKELSSFDEKTEETIHELFANILLEDGIKALLLVLLVEKNALNMKENDFAQYYIFADNTIPFYKIKLLAVMLRKNIIKEGCLIKSLNIACQLVIDDSNKATSARANLALQTLCRINSLSDASTSIENLDKFITVVRGFIANRSIIADLKSLLIAHLDEYINNTAGIKRLTEDEIAIARELIVNNEVGQFYRAYLIAHVIRGYQVNLNEIEIAAIRQFGDDLSDEDRSVVLSAIPNYRESINQSIETRSAVASASTTTLSSNTTSISTTYLNGWFNNLFYSK